MSLINKEVSEFSVKAYQNNAFRTITKDNLLGQWSVFFFYPADFTFVCPTELEVLENHYDAFQKLGCEIYSVSCDTEFVHKAWHDESERIQKVAYPMLADPAHVLAEDFEVLIESDGLAERGVHATFFVNGVNASGWPETLRRIVREGHQLANHTYNHKNLNTCSAKTVQAEIDAVQTLITAAGGDENAYIRAPYGNANKTVRSVVRAPLIYWSVDPEDWKYRNAETVRSNIEAGVFDGAIILVHDIYKTSVDGALAASVFHKQIINIGELKTYLADQGVEIRVC